MRSPSQQISAQAIFSCAVESIPCASAKNSLRTSDNRLLAIRDEPWPRGGGGRGVDAATSRPLPGAAFERALDSRHRYDGEAALRPSGRSGGGLQSEEARSTEPLLSLFSMAGTRLVFDVDVCAGDEHASNHAAPALWASLDRTARDCWPTLLRGDKGSRRPRRSCAKPSSARWRICSSCG